MLKKVSGFIMFLIGCIMIVGMSIFLIYFNIIQKQPITDISFLLYMLYLIFFIFIAVGYSIIDDVEKTEKEKEKK